MDFTQSLKSIAQQIIELGEKLAERTHTWKQETSSPPNDYSDRAGFIINDEIQLFTDVLTPQDSSEGIMRARLAWSPVNSEQNVFTTITLDFASEIAKAEKLIAASSTLKRQDLIELLQNDGTRPKLLHVSLESGLDSSDNPTGKRYEYRDEEIPNMTEAEKTEFTKTLTEAYDFLQEKITQQ